MSDEKTTITRVSITGYRRLHHADIPINENGLTLLEGECLSGKTSTILAIAHAICGPEVLDKLAHVINEDATDMGRGTRSAVEIECSNGMKIVRRFTDANNRTGILEFVMPDGTNAKQKELKEFFDSRSLRPSPMDGMSERERLRYLFDGLSVSDPGFLERFEAAEQAYKDAQAEKEAAFQAKENARRHADDVPFHPELGTTEVSTADLLAEQEKALAHNATIDKAEAALEYARRMHAQAEKEATDCQERMEATKKQIAQLQAQLQRQELALTETADSVKAALNTVLLREEEAGALDRLPVEDIREKVKGREELNAKIRQNQLKAAKQDEADQAKAHWKACEDRMKDALRALGATVKQANIPVPGIEVNGMAVHFGGKPWCDMSGMQRKVLETAIASMFNPNARLVIIDGLEALDAKHRAKFHEWAVSRDLQVIGTTVRDTPSDDKASGVLSLWVEDGNVSA